MARIERPQRRDVDFGMKGEVHIARMLLKIWIVVKLKAGQRLEAHEDRTGLKIVEIAIDRLLARAAAAVHRDRVIECFLGQRAGSCQANGANGSCSWYVRVKTRL